MNDWKKIGLGDIATYYNGYAFKPSDWSDEGKEIIRIQNLTKGAAQINYFTGELDEKYKVRKGDLLISWSATLGIYEWDSDDAWLNQHLFKVVFDKEETDKLFFKYLIGFSLRKMEEQVHGATMKHITKKKFDAFPVLFPPLETQKKIAAILDAADAYRQKTKALIAKYDELTQSLFLEMFGDPVRNEKGWEKVSLSKLCFFDKKSVKPVDIKSGENYVALDSIEKETGEIIEIYKPLNGQIKSNKFIFDETYILYGKLRPYLNKVALPDFSGICSTDIIPIKPNQKVTNKHFIAQLMKGSWFVNYANERVSGANLPRISPNEIAKFPTINPDYELQNQFAERVQAIDRQKTQAQTSLEKSEELFNSLLQRAFKGELV